MKWILTSVLVLTACGGGASPKATTPAVSDPVPMNEGSAAAKEPATPADPANVKAELLAAERTAYERAKPVFDKWCASCHSKDGSKTSPKKREHFDMTTYPFGGHHAMEISDEIREVLGVTGKKPTMPADNKGAVKGEELELIKAWADAFDASHKAGAHEGHGSGHAH